MTDLMNKQPTLSKPAHSIAQALYRPTGPGQVQVYERLGAAMATELAIGFWFGIGVILAVKMVNSLDYYIKEIIS